MSPADRPQAPGDEDTPEPGARNGVGGAGRRISGRLRGKPGHGISALWTDAAPHRGRRQVPDAETAERPEVFAVSYLQQHPRSRRWFHVSRQRQTLNPASPGGSQSYLLYTSARPSMTLR